MPLLLRSSRRYYAHHPWQLVLCILGIAVGVAVVLAIDLSNRSAERAFEWAARTVSGRATHQIVAAAPGGIPESLYAQLKLQGSAVGKLAPIVQGMVRLQRGTDGAFVAVGATEVDEATPSGLERFDLTVLGIDPLAEAPLRPWAAFAAGAGGAALPLDRWLVEPGAFALSASTAERLGIRRDQRVPLRVQGRWVEGALVAILEPRDAVTDRGLDQVLLTDVATAQEWLGKRGRLDRIDAVLSESQAARLVESLPVGFDARAVGAGSGALRELTQAFRTNLQALSLLALVVGAFLIYNTLRFAVIQRRQQFGILRALGVTRGTLFGVVLVEALVLGLVGTGLGLAMGVVLAERLVGLVAQTINDLYTSVAVTDVAVPVGAVWRAAGLGLGACIVAALAPAREAMRLTARDVLVRSTLEKSTRARVPRAAAVAALCGVVAWAFLAWDTRAIEPAYAGLFAILLAAAALTPAVCLGFLALARAPLHRLLGTAGSLAARGAAAGLSRTAVAVAALTLAVATTVGLGMMIHSFRGSVSSWLEDALVRDVYVTVPAVVSDRNATVLAPEVAAALERTEGVAGVVRYRRADVAVRWPAADRAPGALADATALVVAYGPESPRAEPGYGFDPFEFLDGDGAAARARCAAEPDAVWVSEPFAFRHGLERGQAVELRTPGGWRQFPIVGVFRDYGSEQGVVMMHRSLTWLPRFGDEALSSLALDAAPGVAVDDLVARLRQAAARAGGEDPQALSVRSNRALRDASMEVFDRTFAVTAALRGLCLVVAFFGIWSALMALQWERRREIALLRALGAVPRQVVVLVMTQTGLLGLCAGLFAIPVGAVLGGVLAYAINRRSFGWSLLDVSLPWGVAVEAVVLGLGAALCAGLWPAWRLSRAPMASSLRAE